MKTLARFTVVVGIAIGMTACLGPKEMPASNLTPEHSVAVELRHASAIDVADTLNDLVAASRAAAADRSKGECVLYAPGQFPDPKPFVPIARADARANVVMVRVDAEEEPRVRELIARLDVPR